MLNEVPGPEGPALDEFFVEVADHSNVKTTIATKFFFTWAGIISGKTRSPRIASQPRVTRRRG